MKTAIILLVCFICAVAVSADPVDWSKVLPPPVRSAQLGSPEGRITNGNLAEPKQFPYQVGLLLYVEGGAAWCGGSLISDRWIVTAAHCTESLTTGVDVYLGTFNRLDSSEEGHQKVFVDKRYVIVHENYDNLTITNDISLIKLPVKIQFNDYIQPVKLPKMANTYDTYVGADAIASGWGLISDEATTVTDKLRWIEVPIMSNSACNIRFLGLVKSSNICIKTTGGYSTCNGDSGGPLVESESKTLIGLTSFGLSLGCEVGWPGVFTRITSYLDWIDQHTGIVEK